MDTNTDCTISRMDNVISSARERGERGNCCNEEMMNSIDVGTTTPTTQNLVVVASGEIITSPPPSSRSCCLTMWDYGENGDMYEARGYALLAMGESYFLSGAFINLVFGPREALIKN